MTAGKRRNDTARIQAAVRGGENDGTTILRRVQSLSRPPWTHNAICRRMSIRKLLKPVVSKLAGETLWRSTCATLSCRLVGRTFIRDRREPDGQLEPSRDQRL